MTGAAFVIWLHGLAALLFCGAALMEVRRPVGFVPRWSLLLALGLSALWALGVAGIGEAEVPVRVTQVARNLAWVAVLFTMTAPRARRVGYRSGAYLATALCLVLAGAVAVAQPAFASGANPSAAEATWRVLRLLSTIAALVLLHRHAAETRDRIGGAQQMLIATMGVMWAVDLLVLALAHATGAWTEDLTILRGCATVLVAVMALIAISRRADRSLRVSRGAAAQAMLLGAGALYVVAATAATGLLGRVGGEHARVVQAVFVFGTGAAVLTIVTTPWLRAWSKVMVAKHLFSHRYDYRAEWMRFTDTLGVSGEDAAPLPLRIVQAVADLTASPAGLLLYATRDGMVAGPAWRWDEAPAAAAPLALEAYLRRTGRIIDLDSCRIGEAPPEEIAALPEWLRARAEAWAIVPLLRADALIGAIVLARPPATRALDWEDFDLLGAAGRQAASYLAEERAQAALADAQRFDEFNRRFAFIMHDLKNLVSQTALVARNAERHADNPAFRADMVATLQDTSQRMTALLARLGQHTAPAHLAPGPIDLLQLARRIADGRRAQHSVEVSGAGAVALADAAAVETMIGHLVQNAVEASAADAPVHLHVVAVDDRAIVEVRDRGCGMAADFLRDQLFRPFASAKPGGFGLGAFEARQIAEQMGGSMTVTSREGEGTCCRVALPIAPALEQVA
ncbi:XrtA/PEP-CTERM system histidine kinase PrsK [Sphingomonas sp.]|uniref:XrtA/PEP-CTERM system histidine kinase PrsK n=1 Tax=Sphingomonas sp. TaxID=28214 RepID=UPI0035C7D3DD